MSALPPKADIVQHGDDVGFVPKADILQGLLRAATTAYEAASEHNPPLCSNSRLVASQLLRGRSRRKAAEVKASQCQLYR
jgi:hypothetical protein